SIEASAGDGDVRFDFNRGVVFTRRDQRAIVRVYPCKRHCAGIRVAVAQGTAVGHTKKRRPCSMSQMPRKPASITEVLTHEEKERMRNTRAASTLSYEQMKAQILRDARKQNANRSTSSHEKKGG